MILRRLRQLASESVIYGLAGVLVSSMSFVLVPIYTRVFTPGDYGVMSLVTTTMAVVSVFVVLALDNSAHRWFWDTENEGDRKSTLSSWAWCQMTLSCLVGVAIFFAADSLGRVLVGRPDVGLYFRLTALSIPLGSLGKVLVNWLRMQRRAWATVAFSVATTALSLVLTVLLVVLLRLGLVGVYVAQLATAAATMIISVALLRDWVNPRHIRWLRLREMLVYALPLVPAALGSWVINLSDRYFVQYYNSTAQVGLYQVANSVAAIVALATSAFQQAWGPFALSIHKEDEAKAVYASVLLVYAWLTCFLSTALSLLAPEVVSVVATKTYLGASTAVSYLAFSYVMVGLYYIAGLGPALAKTTKPVAVAVGAGAGLNTALNFALVPRMGMQGAAISTLLSQTTMAAFLFYRAQRIHFIPYRFAPVLGLMALSLSLVVAAGLWRPGSLWLGVAGKLSMLAIFFPAAFVLRIVSVDQVKRAIAGRFSLKPAS